MPHSKWLHPHIGQPHPGAVRPSRGPTDGSLTTARSVGQAGMNMERAKKSHANLKQRPWLCAEAPRRMWRGAVLGNNRDAKRNVWWLDIPDASCVAAAIDNGTRVVRAGLCLPMRVGDVFVRSMVLRSLSTQGHTSV